MHEDLLGYLLGALEPDEMHRVSERIKSDPEAQQLLAEIERSLRPLEDGFRAVEPPSEDLLARTMAAIPEGVPPGASDQPTEEPKPSTEEAVGELLASHSATPASAVRVTLADIDLSREPSGVTSRWNWMDSVGSLLSVAVLLALLLPTLAAGRFQSRKVACQNHLREFGTALMQYVYRDHQGRLPQVAQSGKEAFAGVFTLRLADAGLLPDGGVRWSPSADMPEMAAQSSGIDSDLPNVNSESLLSLDRLPRIMELQSLSVNELQQVQRYAGGHYAYTLGVLGDHGYASPRYEARTAFAVMSDAPIGRADQSDGTIQFSHGNQGMNVLFEDGAVRFIRAAALDSMPDHPLLNHDGDSEAGVNIDDASLAPSWRPPFSGALQR